MEVSPVDVRDAREIERAVAAFARASNGGLIVTASAPAISHRDLIITLAARHRLPAVYPARFFVTAGGLISYGPDIVDQYRHAAGYVDRILKGEKPADLPVQAPTKYELVHQPQDRQGARPRRAADAARPRRRGDRVRTARVHHAARRRGGCVAAGGAGAAAGDAGRRLRQRPVNRGNARLGAAFRKALNETGYVEGQNVMVEYHWLDGQYDRLPALMADLVRRRVAVIATPGFGDGALAAKAATTTIPIVFGVAQDPVKLGLVASLARPGGNATGINLFSAEIGGQAAGTLARLGAQGRSDCRAGQSGQLSDRRGYATRHTGRRPCTSDCKFRSSRPAPASEIEAAFATLVRDRADALFVAPDGFFTSRRVQFATLAARHAIPAAYSNRELSEVGGLMSYGTDTLDYYRQAGVYTGQILKGAKPADLPVLQSTKFEFVINLQDGQGAWPRRAAARCSLAPTR